MTYRQIALIFVITTIALWLFFLAQAARYLLAYLMVLP